MAPPRSYSDESVERRRALGAEGEAATAREYERAGYRVLERNWRCRDGEIDLIVTGKDQIVFCEVKTRSSDAFGPPASAVTLAKQRRIRHLAMRWLDGHAEHRGRIRFDVASVIDGAVEIITGAF